MEVLYCLETVTNFKSTNISYIKFIKYILVYKNNI